MQQFDWPVVRQVAASSGEKETRHEIARLRLQKTKTKATTLDPRLKMSRMTERGKDDLPHLTSPYKGEGQGALPLLGQARRRVPTKQRREECAMRSRG